MDPPRLVPDVERAAALMASWSPSGERELGLVQATLRCLRRDGTLYSDIFEPSVSCDANRPSSFRFSFAFPRLESRRPQVAASLEELCAPLGEAAAAFGRKVMSAARHPAIEQVLFGYARDSSATSRTKFYLQIRDGGDGAGLARTLLGSVPVGTPESPLHLIGLDFGMTGLCGAKLYFRRAAMEAAESSEWLEGWRLPLRRVLMIHRVGEPGDAAGMSPAEIEFSLGENGLDWSAVSTSPLAAVYPDTFRLLDRVSRDFSIRIKSITVSRPPRRHFNAYYVLA